MPARPRTRRRTRSRARRSCRSSPAEDELKEGDEPSASGTSYGDEKRAPRRAGADEGGARSGARGRRGARGRKFFVVPEGQIVLTCGRHRRRRPRPPSRAPGGVCADADLLLPLQVPAEQRGEPGPGADRRGPERRRHAPGLRRSGPADRRAPVHGRGRRQVPRHHARARAARAPGRGADRRRPAREEARQLRPELRDRARQRDPLLPDHRLHRPQLADGIAGGSAQIEGPRLGPARRRTSRSSSRPARCRSSSRRSSATQSRPRSARTRSARR